MNKGLTEKEKKLKKAIIELIIFFDIFSYPLTVYEVWRYLSIESTYYEVEKILKYLKKENLISEELGFFFLLKKKDLLKIRQSRYHHANRKMKKAKKAAKLFSYLPWVKFVALSNLIGRHNMRDASDIDLFIITENNRLWLTRFFCAGLMKILNKRPSKKTKRDKICLSFYVDDKHLNLERLTLKDKEDYYFYYWLAGLYPLYDANFYHFKLMQENQWLKNYLPNIDFLLNNHSYKPSLAFKFHEKVDFKFIKRIIYIFEKIFKFIQLKIMPQELKKIANLDNRVVINDSILKLYLIDRRQEFIDKYNKNLNEFYKKIN